MQAETRDVLTKAMLLVSGANVTVIPHTVLYCTRAGSRNGEYDSLQLLEASYSYTYYCRFHKVHHITLLLR